MGGETVTRLTEMSSEKIMIVDDDLSMSLNLEEMLNDGGYSLTPSVHSGKEALRVARKQLPLLVLMDINLGSGMDGIDAAWQLLQELDIPVIFITGHDDPELIERAKVCRPLGYVLKPVSERQLLTDIELAIAEVNARKRSQDFDGNVCPPGFSDKYPDLTPTELRIAYRISQGKSNKEVAEFLNISETTVQWHRRNIRKKLNLTNTGKNLSLKLRLT